MYKEPRTCECGYTTSRRDCWSHHKKRCTQVTTIGDKERIASLERQLVAKDEQMKAKDEQMKANQEQLKAKDEQMKAKDEQIRELMKEAKKPRTVTNNNIINVDVTVTNAYGNESMSHITDETLQRLIKIPDTAVSELIKITKRLPGNKNVRCPNKKRSTYQVVVADEAGCLQWENRPKGDVLEELYETNATILEAKAYENDTIYSDQFLTFQDKVKESQGGEAKDGGRRYHNQLDKIHCVITS